MCICIYMYIYVYQSTFTCAYVYIYICISIYTYLYIYMYAYKDTCISICISAYSESVRLRAPLLDGVHKRKNQGKRTEACTAEASVAEVFIASSWA